MSFEPCRELDQFAVRFLKNGGAVVEKTRPGFEALLPESLSRLLGTAEHIRINNSSAPESGKVYSISYGSSLLEKMVDAACGKVPVTACRLDFDYLKSQGFERMIEEQFQFHRSKGEVESSASVKAVYLILTCRYLAQSDEQKQGLIELSFNYETGAFVPEMRDGLAGIAKEYTNPPDSFLQSSKLEAILDRINSQSKEILREELNSFKQSMTRRFSRDVTNLEEYYESLGKEMQISLERPGLSKKLIADRKNKIAALPEEFSQKKDDLFKKYSIRVKVEPCAALFILSPAVRVLYALFVGKARKSLALTYNPVNRSMDPLVCQGCGRSIRDVCFCEHLHILCPGCNERCPVCRAG